MQQRIIEKSSKYNEQKQKKEQQEIADASLLLHEQETILKDLFKRYQKGEIPLKQAIEYQSKVVQPLIDSLRNKKYKHMYLEVDYQENKTRLWQYTSQTMMEEFNKGEPPRVLVFKTK
jgi:hypothetical protein